MPQIVTLNVSQTVAPTPSTLQSKGALISQGATSLAQGSISFLTQFSDLQPLLASALAISSMTWSGGVVTVTTAAAIPGLTTPDTFITTIAGVTPSAYNGTYLATVTGANTFTVQLATNPGAETVAGTYTPPNQGELIAMATTFFDQSSAQGVYVLELGAGDGSTGPTALATWITDNPGVFYSYLVPRLWDATANYLAFVANYEALNAKTYFFTTTKTTTYSSYTSKMKCVVLFVEAPSIPLTEFSCAAAFQHALAYSPSSANPVAPMAWAFLYGVTPYPTTGNTATLASLDTAGVSYVTTGAQGGISTSCLANGKTADGKPFTYWYAIDYLTINIPLNISNAIINAANNGAPINFDQNGIDYLQDVAFDTISNAVTYNLLNGQVTRTDLDQTTFLANYDADDYADQNVINAVPFGPYVSANPTAYAQGLYGGYTAIVIPQQGMEQVIFNLNATQFVS